MFTAIGVRPHGIFSGYMLLRLTNGRLYIGQHVQEYLVGLHVEWEERPDDMGPLRNALNAGGAPSPFSIAEANGQ